MACRQCQILKVRCTKVTPCPRCQRLQIQCQPSTRGKGRPRKRKAEDDGDPKKAPTQLMGSAGVDVGDEEGWPPPPPLPPIGAATATSAPPLDYMDHEAELDFLDGVDCEILDQAGAPFEFGDTELQAIKEEWQDSALPTESPRTSNTPPPSTAASTRGQTLASMRRAPFLHTLYDQAVLQIIETSFCDLRRTQRLDMARTHAIMKRMVMCASRTHAPCTMGLLDVLSTMLSMDWQHQLMPGASDPQRQQAGPDAALLNIAIGAVVRRLQQQSGIATAVSCAVSVNGWTGTSCNQRYLSTFVDSMADVQSETITRDQPLVFWARAFTPEGRVALAERWVEACFATGSDSEDFTLVTTCVTRDGAELMARVQHIAGVVQDLYVSGIGITPLDFHITTESARPTPSSDCPSIGTTTTTTTATTTASVRHPLITESTSAFMPVAPTGRGGVSLSSMDGDSSGGSVPLLSASFLPVFPQDPPQPSPPPPPFPPSLEPAPSNVSSLLGPLSFVEDVKLDENGDMLGFVELLRYDLDDLPP